MSKKKASIRFPVKSLSSSLTSPLSSRAGAAQPALEDIDDADMLAARESPTPSVLFTKGMAFKNVQRKAAQLAPPSEADMDVVANNNNNDDASAASSTSTSFTTTSSDPTYISLNINVCVRVRPLNQREMSLGATSIIDMSDNTCTIRTPNDGPPKKFSFYKCFDSYTPTSKYYGNNEGVWNDVGKDVLIRLLNGFNTTLFAYGQTGSGKSYSMMGYGSQPGIIPKLCSHLFPILEQCDLISYAIQVSMLEVYNENIYDLLTPHKNATSRKGLKIRSSQDKGVYVENLTHRQVHNYKELETAMEDGTMNRTIAATNMNATSSRAHTIFTLEVSAIEAGPNGPNQFSSKCHLVDLAGSERVDSAGSTGDRLREGAAINASLSALGNVISAAADMSQGKKKVFVPYRNSVLTRLLQDSIGGNSYTLMIAAISPSDVNYEETLSTLRYADRCGKIMNRSTSKRIKPIDLNSFSRGLQAIRAKLEAIDFNVPSEQTMQQQLLQQKQQEQLQQPQQQQQQQRLPPKKSKKEYVQDVDSDVDSSDIQQTTEEPFISEAKNDGDDIQQEMQGMEYEQKLSDDQQQDVVPSANDQQTVTNAASSVPPIPLPVTVTSAPRALSVADRFKGGPALDDRPLGDDKLSHSRYAERLAEVLCSPSTQPPITVGIYAQWGGGKSFFLEKLKYFFLAKVQERNDEWKANHDDAQERKMREEIEALQHELDELETASSCNYHKRIFKRYQISRKHNAYWEQWGWLVNKREAERNEKQKRGEVDVDNDDDDDANDDDAQNDINDASLKQPLAPSSSSSDRPSLQRRSSLARASNANSSSSASTTPPPYKPSFFVKLCGWLGLDVTTIRAIASIWRPLDRNKQSNLPIKFHFIDFNSWLYSGSDSLWAAFASHLFAETERHFGSYATRAYRARYNDAFGKFSKLMFLITFIITATLIILIVLIIIDYNGSQSVASSSTSTALPIVGGSLLVSFLGFLWSSKDVIKNLITSQAASIMATMDKPDFSSRMGFMNHIKTEIDIISSMMRHGKWYDSQTGIEHASQFVVFIDDLDRCPAEKVVEVLKALVLLFSSPDAPFIAILAIDPRLVVQAIESVHAIGSGSMTAGSGMESVVNGYEYLDKIVQLPFCFPELLSEDKQRLLHSFLPPQQSLIVAFQHHDHKEVASLMLKHVFGAPGMFREELKTVLSDLVKKWCDQIGSSSSPSVSTSHVLDSSRLLPDTMPLMHDQASPFYHIVQLLITPSNQFDLNTYIYENSSSMTSIQLYKQLVQIIQTKMKSLFKRASKAAKDFSRLKADKDALNIMEQEKRLEYEEKQNALNALFTAETEKLLSASPVDSVSEAALGAVVPSFSPLDHVNSSAVAASANNSNVVNNSNESSALFQKVSRVLDDAQQFEAGESAAANGSPAWKNPEDAALQASSSASSPPSTDTDQHTVVSSSTAVNQTSSTSPSNDQPHPFGVPTDVDSKPVISPVQLAAALTRPADARVIVADDLKPLELVNSPLGICDGNIDWNIHLKLFFPVVSAIQTQLHADIRASSNPPSFKSKVALVKKHDSPTGNHLVPTDLLALDPEVRDMFIAVPKFPIGERDKKRHIALKLLSEQFQIPYDVKDFDVRYLIYLEHLIYSLSDSICKEDRDPLNLLSKLPMISLKSQHGAVAQMYEVDKKKPLDEFYDVDIHYNNMLHLREKQHMDFQSNNYLFDPTDLHFDDDYRGTLIWHRILTLHQHIKPTLSTQANQKRRFFNYFLNVMRQHVTQRARFLESCIEKIKENEPNTTLHQRMLYYKLLLDSPIIAAVPYIQRWITQEHDEMMKRSQQESDKKKKEREADRKGLSSIEIRALAECSPYLDGNPRRIKRIMNIYNVARLLIDRDRHEKQEQANQLNHQLLQYNSEIQRRERKKKKQSTPSTEIEMLDLNLVFFRQHLSYSFVRPCLFRFVLFLEQWPYRASWLLHLVQQSNQKWFQFKKAVREMKKQRRALVAPGSHESPVPDGWNIEFPIDYALSCGMFPPNWSVLQLYRYCTPLIYGHRQPRRFDDALMRGRALPKRPEPSFLNKAIKLINPQTGVEETINTTASMDMAVRAFLSAINPNENVPTATLPSSTASDYDHSIERHVRDTESMLSMDSSPDNFILFLSQIIDRNQVEEEVDPEQVTIQIDGASTQPATSTDTSSTASPEPPNSTRSTSSSSWHLPNILTLVDLLDIQYLAFNLNPALRRSVSLLADITAGYLPVEAAVEEYARLMIVEERQNDNNNNNNNESVTSASSTLNSMSKSTIAPTQLVRAKSEDENQADPSASPIQARNWLKLKQQVNKKEPVDDILQFFP